MKTLSVLSFLVLGLTSCQSLKDAQAKRKAKENALPPQYELLSEIPMESNAQVMRTAQIKAYPVGRYIDPSNKDIMHEGHVIYRRERPETWRLYTNHNGKIIRGPQANIRNPIGSPSPNIQELNAELNRQKLVSQQLLAIQQRASSGDERAQELMRMAKGMQANNQALVKRIEDYNANVLKMQNDLDVLRKRQDDRDKELKAVPSPPPDLGQPQPPTTADPGTLEAPPKESGDEFKTNGFKVPFLKR